MDQETLDHMQKAVKDAVDLADLIELKRFPLAFKDHWQSARVNSLIHALSRGANEARNVLVVLSPVCVC